KAVYRGAGRLGRDLRLARARKPGARGRQHALRLRSARVRRRTMLCMRGEIPACSFFKAGQDTPMQVSRFSAFGRDGWRKPAALLALLGALGMMPSVAWAQQPDLDQTFLNAPNVLDGNLIRFCVYPESAIGHLEEELAHVL